MRVGQAGPFYVSFLQDVTAAFLHLLTQPLALPHFFSYFPFPSADTSTTLIVLTSGSLHIGRSIGGDPLRDTSLAETWMQHGIVCHQPFELIHWESLPHVPEAPVGVLPQDPSHSGRQSGGCAYVHSMAPYPS
jgi:hypothetical protein